MTEIPFLTRGVNEAGHRLVQRAATLAPYTRYVRKNPALLIGALALGIVGALAWRNRAKIAATAGPLLQNVAAKGQTLVEQTRATGEDLFDTVRARGEALVETAKLAGEAVVAKARDVRAGSPLALTEPDRH